MTASGFLQRHAKSLISCVGAIVLVVGVAPMASAQLQVRYTFEPNGSPADTVDVIHDRSGNGNNGFSITNSESTFVPGPSGNMNAIHFDTEDSDNSAVGSGVSTGIDTFSLGIANSDFTTMAWVNRDTYKGDNMVFGTGSDESSSDGSLHLGFRGRDIYMGFWGNDSNTSGVTRGQWHHIAWRYITDGGKQDIFIDGVLANSSPNHNPYAKARVLLVGRTSYNGGAFAGSISDARVYNVALSDSAIAGIAASPP